MSTSSSLTVNSTSSLTSSLGTIDPPLADQIPGLTALSKGLECEPTGLPFGLAPEEEPLPPEEDEPPTPLGLACLPCWIKARPIAPCAPELLEEEG